MDSTVVWISNRCFRFSLFKLHSYSLPHKNSFCSSPILAVPARVHLAHQDPSPSQPQPSSCSAIADSSVSRATSSRSGKWLLWKRFQNLVSASPLLCWLPDGGHQPLDRIPVPTVPRALSPLPECELHYGWDLCLCGYKHIPSVEHDAWYTADAQRYLLNRWTYTQIRQCIAFTSWLHTHWHSSNKYSQESRKFF